MGQGSLVVTAPAVRFSSAEHFSIFQPICFGFTANNLTVLVRSHCSHQPISSSRQLFSGKKAARHLFSTKQMADITKWSIWGLKTRYVPQETVYTKAKL